MFNRDCNVALHRTGIPSLSIYLLFLLLLLLLLLYSMRLNENNVFSSNTGGVSIVQITMCGWGIITIASAYLSTPHHTT